MSKLKSKVFDPNFDMRKTLKEWARSPEGQKSLQKVFENEKARDKARREIRSKDFDRQKKQMGK